MRSSSTLTSITGRRGRSARISIPKAQAQARMPSVLQTASSQPRRQSVFASPRAAQGKASSPFYSEVPSDSHGAARPSPAASRSRHKALLSETSKPVRRRRVDKPTLSRMTKTQFLTPALSRRTAGLAPARFVDTRGPLVPAARAGHAALPMGRAAQATDTLRSLKCAAAGLVDAAL